MDDAITHRQTDTYTYNDANSTSLPWSDKNMKQTRRKTDRQTHRKTGQLTTAVKRLTLWKVTNASRRCRSADGARLPLVAPLPREEWLEVGSMPLAMVAFSEVILCNALNTIIATGVGGIQCYDAMAQAGSKER